MKNFYHLFWVMALLLAGNAVSAQVEPSSAGKEDIAVSAFKKTGAFSPNVGQVLDENYQPVTNVLAKSSLPGLDIYLTETGVSYVLLNYELDSAASQHPVYITNNNHFKVHYSRVDVKLVGATLTQTQLEFTNEETYKASYYYGDIKAEGVSSYKDVTVKNVYPGIDWHWFINSKGQPEYDFVVHTGYSSNVIKMQYQYADITPGIDNILISTRNGALREGTLKAFAAKQKVAASYHYNEAEKEVTFNIGGYNTANDLVIDPPLQLQWSGQYGGTFADGLRGVAANNVEIYLAGYTTSVNFPVYKPYPSAYFDSTFNGNTDVIVLQVSNSQNLLWATYLGGPGNDFANSIDINSGNNIAITGSAQSGYPTTYYTSGYKDTSALGQDVFVTRFTYYLSMAWSTFYGGNAVDEGLKIDYSGNTIHVTGFTHSGASFPVYNAGTYTRLPADSFNNPFILQFSGNNLPLSLTWATGLRDTVNSYGTALGISNHIVLGGFSYGTKLNYFGGNPALLTSNGGIDGFIVHFNQPGVPEFERYLGGSGNDYVTDLVSLNNATIVTGYTNSINFPTLRTYSMQYLQPQLAGGYDAFVTLFETDSLITWSTYYGGNAADVATGVATDSSKIGLTGFTFSTDFPVDSSTGGGYYQPVNKGNSDGFIAAFTMHGIRTYSSYKGDSCYEYPADIAVTAAYTYVCGEGLFACNQSLPDSVFINGNSSGINGFCWAFGSVPSTCLPISASIISNVCRDTIAGPDYGIAKVIYSGGQAPYNVIWSSGETTDTAYMLTEGTNLVMVEDSAGCAGEVPLLLRAKSFGFSPSSGNCFNDGTANASVNYGNPPYTYLWSTGSTQPNFNAPPGVYSATVTDNMNCVVSGSMTIGVSTSAKYDIEVWQHPGCGNNNGILVARRWFNANNYQPYTAAWYDSNNQYLGTDDTLLNVDTGTYYINVFTCQNNQQVHPTVTLTDPGIQSNIQITLQQQTAAGCLVGTGYVRGILTGSSYTPCTYYWSNGLMQKESSSYIEARILQYGHTYTVTVTDSVGCTATASITPLVKDSILVNPIIHAPYCFNDNDGYIEPRAYTLSGSNSFRYYWEGPGLFVSNDYTTLVDSLPGGVYELTVYDTYTGCINDFSWDISPRDADNILIESQPVGCNSMPGYAKVKRITPTPLGVVYYNWYDQNNNLISNTDSIGNVLSGHYYVRIESTNPDSTYHACVYIGMETAPPSVTIVRDTTAPCYQPNKVKALVTGGAPPFVYVWNGNSQFPNTPYGQISNLGIATVVVTDYLGCRFVDTAAIAYQQAFGVTMQVQNWCNANLVNVVSTPSGGYPPYSGDTGVYTFAPGNHQLVFYDSTGCAIERNFYVYSHSYLQASYIVNTPATCTTPGSITISANGGQAPYSGVGNYAFNTGSNTFVIADAQGCRDTLNFNVPQVLQLNYTASPLSCLASTSTVKLTATCGLPPYSGDTGQYQLPAGVYNFSVTDAAGDTATLTVTLIQPDTLQATYTGGVAPCLGSNAAINISATGGIMPYSGHAGMQYSPAGNYVYVITDSVGCADTLEVTVTEPAAALDLNYLLVNAPCYGDSGSVILITTGGTPAYIYTNGNGGNVPAGAYMYAVTDANGCNDSVQVVVEQPGELVSQLNQSICAGESYSFKGQQLTVTGNYADTLTASTGCDSIVTLNLMVLPALTGSFSDAVCEGYSYLFNNQQLTQAGAYTDTLQGVNGCDSIVTLTLYTIYGEAVTVDTTIQQGSTYTLPDGSTTGAAGTYTDTLLAANGCDSVITTNLSVVSGVGEVATLAGFTLQPNPASSYLYVGVPVPLTGIVVYNITGQQVIVLDKPVEQNNTYRIDVQLLAAGTYVVEVKGKGTAARRRWVKM